MADEDSRLAMLRVLRDLFWSVAFAIVVLVVHVAMEINHRYWMAEQNALILQAIHDVCRHCPASVSQTTNIGVEQRHDEIDMVTRDILKETHDPSQRKRIASLCHDAEGNGLSSGIRHSRHDEMRPACQPFHADSGCRVWSDK